MSEPLPDINRAHEARAPARKKPEDTAVGCRGLERDDRTRAAAVTTLHMRSILERSADAWAARASLLERLEARFLARARATLEEAAKLRPATP